MTIFRRGLAACVAALLVLGLAGCSTGDDQAVYGGSFTFASPGGKVEFSYPPAERKTIGVLRGPDLMSNETISISDYAGQVVAINFWGLMVSAVPRRAGRA